MSASKTTTDTLQAALDLAQHGRAVFPCRDAPGVKGVDKTPYTVNGHTMATRDPKLVRAFFTENPGALVGMATGAASGITVVDIDTKNGKQGAAWLKENKDRLPLKTTTVVRSRSGGLHLYFRHPTGVNCSTDKIANGVDIRGDGGYAIAWGAHGCTVECDAEPAPMPDWLLREIWEKQPESNGGTETAIERRMPPSVDTVVDLLDRMQNPAAVGRDTYVTLGLAAAACAKLTEDTEGLIRAAWISWADRWGVTDTNKDGLAPPGDAEAKWDTDFSKTEGRLAGWQSLVKHAHELIPGFSDEVAEQRERDAENEFPPLTPEDLGEDAAHDDGDHCYGASTNRTMRWLVKGVLPERGAGLLSGQWAAGKTFIAMDLAVAVMFASTFAGPYRVKQHCGVLWLAAEGASEVDMRLKAALDARGFGDTPVSDVPFIWREDIPTLLETGSEAKLIETVKRVARKMAKRGIRLGLIILDTMAAAAGWTDENDNAEAQRVMRLMRKVGDSVEAFTLMIDHYGKATDGGTRGASAKEAAADAVLAVLGDRQPDGSVLNRKLALRKVRAGKSGTKHPFALAHIPLGVDEDGDPVDTCTVDWGAAPSPAATGPKHDGLKPAFRQWFDVLDRLLQKQRSANREDWWDAGQKDSSVSTSRSTFRTAIGELLKVGMVERVGEEFRMPNDFDSLLDKGDAVSTNP